MPSYDGRGRAQLIGKPLQPFRLAVTVVDIHTGHYDGRA